MHRHAGGLVHHGGKVILVNNGKGHRLGRHRGILLRRQGKPDGLPRMNRLVGVKGPVIGKKTAAPVLDAAQAARRDAPAPEKGIQTLAFRLRGHKVGKFRHRMPPAHSNTFEL